MLKRNTKNWSGNTAEQASDLDGHASFSEPYPGYFVAESQAENFIGDFYDYQTVDYKNSTAGVNVNLTTGIGSGGYAQGDTYYGIDNIYGSNYDDVLTGTNADNVIFGKGGSDLIHGMGGPDYLDGGTGFDTVSYAASNAGVVVNLTASAQTGGHAQGDILVGFEAVIGSAFNDTLTGTSGFNVLDGGDGRDFINAGAGDDVLFGGAGDDELTGGAGDDYIDGGSGIDLVNYSASTAGVSVYLNSVGYHEGYIDSYESVENVRGSNFGDTLYGNSSDNLILGEAGNDEIYGGGGGLDILIAGTGLDTLLGSDGVEYMDGGADFDVLDYSLATMGVTIDIGNGAGVAGAAAGDVFVNIEAFQGSNFADTFYGSSASDDIRGGDGDDLIIGLDGHDWLYGGAGDDIFVAGLGKDLHDGGEGSDTVDYSAATESIYVNLAPVGVPDGFFGITGGEAIALGDVFSGIENIIGSAYDDTVIGGFEANTFIGGDGRDYLDGGEGSDVLNGDGGQDSLFGGEGGDILNGGQGNDSLFGGAGRDQLNGGDGIDTVSYVYALDGVYIDLTAGIGQGDEAEGDILTGIENVNATAYDDVVIGNADGNAISTGAGVDHIYGMGGQDYLNGSIGDDSYYFSHSMATDATVTDNQGNDALYFRDISIAELNQSRVGDDLHISHASGVNVVVVGQFAGDGHGIEQIHTIEGVFAPITGLLEAMASFAPASMGEGGQWFEDQQAQMPMLAAAA